MIYTCIHAKSHIHLFAGVPAPVTACDHLRTRAFTTRNRSIIVRRLEMFTNHGGGISKQKRTDARTPGYLEWGI